MTVVAVRRRRRRSKTTRPALGRQEWKATRAHVRERDGNACRHCGATFRLSVHHIVPARYGGSDDVDNLVLLCSGCHSRADASFRWRLKHGW
jgi:5-methylcytosine-specific restriction endonuclease McrA